MFNVLIMLKHVSDIQICVKSRLHHACAAGTVLLTLDDSPHRKR